MRMIGTLLGIAAMTYAGFALVLYLLQPSLIYFPEIDRALAATPQQAGLPYEDVKLVTADGVTLHGWLVPAANPPRGSVLFLHGNAGNISHRLDSLRMFHRLGYNTLIVDYRGYGNSAGEPTEQGTYRDAEAAWAYLTQTRGIPAASVVLFGESLGGAIAAWLASRHTPAALIISSGFTSVPDLAADIYPYMPVRWLARFSYDTRAYLRATTAPVFIAHSPGDEIIPFRHGRALYEAAQDPKHFLELAGGHNEGFIFARASWAQTLGEFLQAHVAIPDSHQTGKAADIAATGMRKPGR
ncbi:MAG: alpha/beta hydrolase [Rhodocyclaceae bacterium]|nr:alpha/beta hydrolase [Rhodocyclaceae bacterium]